MRIRTLLPLAAAVLTLSACASSGSTAPVGGETYETNDGSVVAASFPASGLACDFFDTSYGGGVDCNFAAFTAPSSWDGQVGEIESIEVNDSYAALLRFEDGHICVTINGTKSGGMTCHYPAS